MCRQHGFEPATSHEIIDTAVTLALAAKGLAVAPVTDMMIGLNSSVPIIRIALVQEIVRKIVLIRRAGAAARPTCGRSPRSSSTSSATAGDLIDLAQPVIERLAVDAQRRHRGRQSVRARPLPSGAGATASALPLDV